MAPKQSVNSITRLFNKLHPMVRLGKRTLVLISCFSLPSTPSHGINIFWHLPVQIAGHGVFCGWDVYFFCISGLWSHYHCHEYDFDAMVTYSSGIFRNLFWESKGLPRGLLYHVFCSSKRCERYSLHLGNCRIMPLTAGSKNDSVLGWNKFSSLAKGEPVPHDTVKVVICTWLSCRPGNHKGIFLWWHRKNTSVPN